MTFLSTREILDQHRISFCLDFANVKFGVQIWIYGIVKRYIRCSTYKCNISYVYIAQRFLGHLIFSSLPKTDLTDFDQF